MSTRCGAKTVLSDVPAVHNDFERDSTISPAYLIAFCQREARFRRLSGAEAEDVVQDALLALLSRNSSVQNPLAYLRVVIRRQAALLRRSKWLASLQETSSTFEREGRHNPWPMTEMHIDSRRVLRALDQADLRLVSLVHEGHSFSQIGAALGCSEGAARVRVCRVRKKVGPRA